MSRTRTYYVYIMTNKSGTLYIGVTGDINKRVWQHKSKLVEGFTNRYNITRLLYLETFGDVPFKDCQSPLLLPRSTAFLTIRWPISCRMRENPARCL